MHRDSIRFHEDPLTGMTTSTKTPNEIALDAARELLRLPKYMVEKIDNVNTSVNEDCVTIDISFVGQKVSKKAYLFGSDGSVEVVENDLSDDVRNLDLYLEDDIHLADELITRMSKSIEDGKYEQALITTRQLKKLQIQEGEN